MPASLLSNENLYESYCGKPHGSAPRALSILHAEGLNPNSQDVTLMLQSFDGSARDLIDLIEETVMASKAVTP